MSDMFSRLQRYSPSIGNQDYEGDAWATMQADNLGDYVRLEDVMSALPAVQPAPMTVEEAARVLLAAWENGRWKLGKNSTILQVDTVLSALRALAGCQP